MRMREAVAAIQRVGKSPENPPGAGQEGKPSVAEVRKYSGERT